MAGEQKRKARAALVTKALLLGYTFVSCEGGCHLVMPSGRRHFEWKHKGGMTRGPVYSVYPALWLAAKEALKLSGVPDATKS